MVNSENGVFTTIIGCADNLISNSGLSKMEESVSRKIIEEHQSIDKVASKLQLTYERVRQIYKSSITKMKAVVTERMNNIGNVYGAYEDECAMNTKTYI